MSALAADIKAWARELGFATLGIADTDLGEAEGHLMNWLAKDRHGEMGYMAEHGTRRSRPADLVPGTVRVLSVRLPYWPKAREAESVLNDPALGYVARYALGRDYHKVLRHKLQKLADRIESAIGPFGYRVFTDSAPVLEKALAEKAGLGWIGKHTNLIDKDEGSWFFLGEMYTDLPLPVDTKSSNHCGTCARCIEVCPTQAIIAPYKLDARRCISYLTIELHGSIPVKMRPMIGNRIFGCDDCQLVCPWNKHAQVTTINDFTPRHGLDTATLIELFSWSEEEFLKRTEGSAIRRLGYERWLRNVAVALGNQPRNVKTTATLTSRQDHSSPLVREHVRWGLDQQTRAR